MAFLVVTGFDVALVVAVADAAAVGAVVATGVAVPGEDEVNPPIAPIPAPMPAVLEVENCGGVIAITAPSPPRVPPAINSARFISYPHP